jgi:long-subunit fatty acid transport protein
MAHGKMVMSHGSFLSKDIPWKSKDFALKINNGEPYKMKKKSKIKMFVTHLPLLIFCRVQLEKPAGNQSHRFQNTLIFLLMAAILILPVPQARGAFLESVAIDPKAISLANTVTANPTGITSIYYNPAGLSQMKDGTYISLGLMPIYIQNTFKYDMNPNFQKFHDVHGNDVDDPVDGKEATNEMGRIGLFGKGRDFQVLTGPVLGFSHREPNSKWTFGFSVYLPYGGGYSFEADSPTKWDLKEVYIQHLVYAGPAVSYRVNKNLSLGVSFGLGQSALGMSLDNRAPNALTNVTKLLGDATQGASNPIFDLTVPLPLFGGGLGPYERAADLSFDMSDDFSPSYNLGLLWEPLDWLSFGANYYSKVESHLSGDFTFSYSEAFQRMVAWSGSTAIMQISSMIFDLPYEPTKAQHGTITTDLQWPQMVNLGIKVKPISKISLMADVHWADWSSTKETNLKFDQKIQLLQLVKYFGYTGGAYNMILRRNLKDTWDWSVGAELQVLDWLTLRAGYEDRQSPTRYEYYDLQYAIPDMQYVGVGMGIDGSGTGIKMLQDVDIDLALGYMWNKSYTVKAGSSENLNVDQLGNYLYYPYPGLDVEQKISFLLAGAKLTMPLEVVTGLLTRGTDILRPSRWRSSTSTAKAITLASPVDSSAAIVYNMRYKNSYYFIEDSE